MKNFTELYRRLDETTDINEKIHAFVSYLSSANSEDSIWAIYFLTGRKPKQIIPIRRLKEWCIELAKISEWLFGESYGVVGDLAETITLLYPRVSNSSNKPLHYWIEEKLFLLKNKREDVQKEEIISVWDEMDHNERFIWNKLITGGFRVNISAKTSIKAISIFSGISEPLISYRLMGDWKPTAEFFYHIISYDSEEADLCKPYPFCLSCQFDDKVENLGNVKDWQAEWKWNGIRSQMIKRKGKFFTWSRGEEMLNEKFPEIDDLKFLIPDGTVFDGEIIAWKNGKPIPFGELQKRISRKNVTKKILNEIPAVIIVYDLLELNGKDIREEPLVKRRSKLSELVNKVSDKRLILSPKIEVYSWDELKEKRAESRNRSVEGLMLKKTNSPYLPGRIKGTWWKWKIDPLIVDAVLIYAQHGNGKWANLYTDYTFGVWNEGELIPISKIHSGLTDEEINKVDLFVRENTVEKFGPVCIVKPELVFELALDGIIKSARHKSGFAVKLSRIVQWQHYKAVKDADKLETIKNMIK